MLWLRSISSPSFFLEILTTFSPGCSFILGEKKNQKQTGRNLNQEGNKKVLEPLLVFKPTYNTSVLRDTNGCCGSPLFLFCWCVTGRLGRKRSVASSGASPSTSCSAAVSCLWLLIFFTRWPNAACPECCPHAGCLREARAKRHTLSVPARLDFTELTFFSQFFWCFHDLGQGLGPGYASQWSLFPCPARSPRRWRRRLWVVFLLCPSLLGEVAPRLSKHLLWCLFPVWKKGEEEGNV